MGHGLTQINADKGFTVFFRVRPCPKSGNWIIRGFEALVKNGFLFSVLPTKLIYGILHTQYRKTCYVIIKRASVE